MTKMGTGRLLSGPKGLDLEKGESVSLEKIIKQCVQTKVSWGLKQNDMVFALAFWSMMECGFRAIHREETKKSQEKNLFALPKNWKHKNRQVYEAHFFLPPYSEHPVKLVALPAGDILCINILASNISPKNINLKSLAIYSPGYVPRPEDDLISSKFSDLGNFQLLLKNLIIWPIRCSILSDKGVLNGSLCGLSDEIKLKIIRNLSVPEILKLAQTCHELNRVCNDQNLWKSLYMKKFKAVKKDEKSSEEGSSSAEAEINWKEEFKKAHMKKQEQNGVQESPTESFHTAPEGTYGSDIDFDID